MPKQDVVATIGAQSDVGPGLDQAGAEIEAWGKRTSSRMAGVIQIRDFIREERGSRRIGSFMAREIAEVIPMSNEARSVVGRFGAALLGGPFAIGITAAVAGLGFVAKQFMDQSEAAEKSEKAMVEWADSVHGKFVTAAEEARLVIAQLEGGMLGAAQEKADIERGRAAADELDATRKRVAEEEKLAKLRRSGFIGISGRPVGEAAQIGAVEAARKAELDARSRYSEVVKKSEAELTLARQKYAAQQTQDVQANLDKQSKAHEAAARAWAAHWKAVFSTPPAGGIESEGLKLDRTPGDIIAEQDFTRALKTTREAIEATRTPAESYTLTVSQLDQALAAGAMTQEVYNRAIERAGKAYVDAQTETRKFVDVGVSGFFSLARAAGQGSDAIVAAFQRMLDSVLSIFEQIASNQIMRMLSPPTGLGGVEIPGGPPIEAPVLVGGPSAKLSPAAAAKSEVHYHISAMDAASFRDFLARNRGAVAAEVSTLAYAGRIG